ncbi:hypothetical protein C1H76_4194 [Elsinoe australis]|uniref:Uncharacterized protein n=1 Tax=Elsinoe australis TaxID=40998 RepID=A0A4U7AYC5_9PEZI|nr:hypothetical protein C1H76_4194 [Elsinoe australis]
MRTSLIYVAGLVALSTANPLLRRQVSVQGNVTTSDIGTVSAPATGPSDATQENATPSSVPTASASSNNSSETAPGQVVATPNKENLKLSDKPESAQNNTRKYKTSSIFDDEKKTRKFKVISMKGKMPADENDTTWDLSAVFEDELGAQAECSSLLYQPGEKIKQISTFMTGFAFVCGFQYSFQPIYIAPKDGKSAHIEAELGMNCCQGYRGQSDVPDMKLEAGKEFSLSGNPEIELTFYDEDPREKYSSSSQLTPA